MYGCRGSRNTSATVPALDHLAGVHHRQPAARLRDHRQVVRHEHEADVELALQLLQQLEDLILDRHVERRRRLVAEDSFGSPESAIAIITRWRMPPESSCG